MGDGQYGEVPVTIWSLDDARSCHCYASRLAMALPSLLPKELPVLDLGCGKGEYLAHLKAVGYRCLGVEGTPGIHEIAAFTPIVMADLSRPLDLGWPKSSIICLEVAEHLLPEQETQLLETIFEYCAGLLVLSWAVPGQGGHGHNNCRSNEYVRTQLIARDFEFLAESTAALRAVVDDTTPWFRETLLVFQIRDRRTGCLQSQIDSKCKIRLRNRIRSPYNTVPQTC